MCGKFVVPFTSGSIKGVHTCRYESNVCSNIEFRLKECLTVDFFNPKNVLVKDLCFRYGLMFVIVCVCIFVGPVI
jgi:hypothetical protein